MRIDDGILKKSFREGWREETDQERCYRTDDGKGRIRKNEEQRKVAVASVDIRTCMKESREWKK